MTRQLQWLLAFTLSAVILLPAQASTQEKTLKNGLKIIVREDHRAPTVVSMVWYKVGSSYEPNGLTGISHVLEHMMFKATSKIANGDFSKIIARYGGNQNAFTSRDSTGYYQIFEASRLPLSFELEASRMDALHISQTDFEKEINVVKEERRLRTDDNPNAMAYERFLTTAYVSSNYQQPVVGWMHDLEAIQVEHLKAWYEQWYAPNNATVVVVGDVNTDDVFQLAEKYFGDIMPRPVPETPIPKEIKSVGERYLKITAPAKVPALYMGFNTPSLNTADEEWEIYALKMLASVLDGGYSARIETNIIRHQKIAASAGAGYSGLSRGDSLFSIHATPAKTATIAELKAAIMAEIEILKTTLATPDELARVQAQIISSRIYQQDSIHSQANEIGSLETNGYSWKISEAMTGKLKAITPEQIQQVAIKYLTESRLTTAELIPGELP